MHTHSEGDIVFTTRPKSKKTRIGANFRGSKFIGVSRNGESWQVYIVIDRRKKYVGCFSSKLEAAAIYDKLAINFHGRKAKTNFSYTKQEVLQII
ncbi:unnamed protein product [Moneuplotes crassus]|uniref:AP2/ERF domain-containing protein n=1 Tax=Euplotes crassus TaxID=5936 RepID=A0AAD1Y687_EUPCR|nr:unnamed protein product [Moneuplotes crassus]